ncbi:hypothetical protein SAMN05192574_102621 [Mucilaginibacter gossypiicola]|uniref:Uncharacterized protein n=1 Tax=Mucilaginibacter gossypiicola TaxID=551995 RepID=A0A1H8E8D1_9SPHI|nr:hypothetical protein [Mucilaginibacter gossypiicola]SEN15779.1 hypothetical protein SAMN05192574_102621 [Mucilaginibacter gossypiicola]
MPNLTHAVSRIKFIINICWLLTTVSFNAFGQNNNGKINWVAYRANSLRDDETESTILLSQNAKGDIYNPLNLLILKTSEWILPDPKPDLSTETALKKLFSALGDQANDSISTPTAQIETTISFSNSRILSYKVRVDSRGKDLLSPYIEYLNIDLEKNKLIETKDIFDANKRMQFNAFLNTYESNHKRELLKNYQAILSERIADQISDDQEILTKPNYTLNKVYPQKPDTAKIINLQAKGIVFQVKLVDRNFTRYKEGNEYISFVFIPYILLKPYFNTRSSLFKTMINLCK